VPPSGAQGPLVQNRDIFPSVQSIHRSGIPLASAGDLQKFVSAMSDQRWLGHAASSIHIGDK
jgi:hypothetical protein